MNNYRTYNTKEHELVISARISDQQQAESGLSIPAQLNRITDYGAKLGFPHPKIFAYIESSTKDRRIKFQELLDYINNSKKKVILVIDTIDRLQRSFRESVTLEQYWKSGKLEIHFYREGLVIHKNSNSSDLLRWDMGVMFARSYVLQLSDNVKRAIDQKLLNGEWPGKAPFGYKNITQENGKKWIVVDEYKSIVVKKLYEWYSVGNISLLGITQKANKEFKLKLSKGFVDYLLKNPFFYGMMLYRDKLYPYKYATIISKELFDKVQQVKAGFHKKPFKYGSKPFAYKGFLVCSVCDYTITAEPHKGHNYYHCTMYGGKHQEITGKRADWIREDELTNQFADLFKSIQVPQDVIEDILKTLRATHEGKIDHYKTISASLKSEYSKYENRLEQLYEDKIDGTISKEFYDKKYEEYRNAQEDIRIRVENLERVDDDYYSNANTLLELANRARELFLGSELDEKRQLLGFVLQNCVFDGKNIDFTLKKPFDTLAICAKRQTWLPR